MSVHRVACGTYYSKIEGAELGGIIVNRGEWFGSSANMKGAHRCQDLGWKVHNHAQSFVLLSYTMHELVYVTNTFLLVSSSVRSEQLLWFVHGQGQKKRTKAYNKEICRVS